MSSTDVGVGVSGKGTARGSDSVLSVRDLSKTFPGQRALADFSMEIHAGEIHALVGHNGCGKSTLIKLITGFHTPDPGATAEFLGESVDLYDAGAPWRDHVHAIHQDLGLIPSMSVIDNIALEHGYLSRAGKISWKAERKRVEKLLRDFDSHVDPRELVDDLSRRDQAIVAIVRAVSGMSDDSSGLLILDEPTATLPEREVQVLFDAVRTAARRGCAVLFVSHRLADVLTICDRVTVLRDGNKVAERSVSGLTRDQLTELIVGNRSASAPNHFGPRFDHRQGRPVIKVKDIATEQLSPLSLTVCAGEIVGIAGLDGSGREDVTRVLSGITNPTGGTVSVGGEMLRVGSIKHSLDAGIAMVPRERFPEGLVSSMTISENLTLPSTGDVVKHGRLSRRLEVDEADRWIESMDIRPRQPDKNVVELSGGNAQKVVMAKWMRTRPRVVLLEEPTAGVDVGAKRSIWAMLDDATRDGAAIIATSSDWEELAANCDRVLVLADGVVQAELHGQELTTDSIARNSMGQSLEKGEDSNE
ncbi:sugar ABC transporter ATP-binding protein [Rhodococcus koreensis]|uniref:sugar ABC transporter ATP-binding protein n=1 Tax=Rhodococcus koreensis TaxID=99653 RepID=UPI003670D46F